MSTEELLGLWYCELVDQEQSDDEAEEFGDYDHFDRPPQKAAATEFATTTIELREDGTYRLEGPEWGSSHGTWSKSDGLALREAEDSSNGFDGLEYAHHSGERLVVAFKLVPDAHDGLDVMVLTFGRTQPAAKGPKPDGLIEQLLSTDDEDEVYELLYEFEDDPAEVERALWDAWVDGRFLSDPHSDLYSVQRQMLEHDNLRKAGGFTHAHARHALTIDFGEQADLFELLIEKIARLPADEVADAELQPLLMGEHVQPIARLRFLGGGLPEEFYRRRVVPQPAMDDACRAYVLRTYYTRFESIERLFPSGHPDFAQAIVRYRGTDLLTLPLSTIEERGVAGEVLEVALELLADESATQSMELWLSCVLLGVVLPLRAGQPLPPIVLENLSKERRGTVMGGLSEDEKARLREMVTALPPEQRKLVHARFWLDQK